MTHTKCVSPASRRPLDRKFQAGGGNLETRSGFRQVPALLKERGFVRNLHIFDARSEVLTFATPLLLHVIG